MVRALLPLALALLAACSTPGGPYPSLQPRSAEAMDPRVPVTRPLNDRAADAGLVTRLRALVAEARQGDAAFAPAVAAAERAAAGAGAAESESWIVAQQALSAAVAARAPTARAQAEIDALGAQLLKANGGIAPNDLKAIEEAAAAVAAIAERQSAAIETIEARLAR
jgi:hypothetical protein